MINKKTTSRMFNAHEYQVFYADGYLSLIKVNSSAAFEYFSQHDNKYEEVTHYDELEKEHKDHFDIYIANTYDGDVFVCDFHNKYYSLNGEPFSFYQWLKNYPQLIPCLADVGIKHHILALQCHQEGAISEQAYYDLINEPCIFYESNRLITCPDSRRAALMINPDLIQDILDTATDDEKLLVAQIDGQTLFYFEETATEQQREVALQQAPHIIHRLENRTHLEVIKALTHYQTEIDFICSANKEERACVIEAHPEIMEIIFSKSTKEERSLAISEDATVIRYFSFLSTEEREQALTQDAHAIIYSCGVTKQERLSAIAKNPFIVGSLSQLTYKEISVALKSTCEDGYMLTELPFVKLTKKFNTPKYELIENKEYFISSLRPDNIPIRIYFDEESPEFRLVFEY